MPPRGEIENSSLLGPWKGTIALTPQIPIERPNITAKMMAALAKLDLFPQDIFTNLSPLSAFGRIRAYAASSM